MPFAAGAAALASASSLIWYYPYNTTTGATTTYPLITTSTTGTAITLDDANRAGCWVVNEAQIVSLYTSGVHLLEPLEHISDEIRQYRLDRERNYRAVQHRARELLHEFLTPLQRATLRDIGNITVRGASGQRYQIHEGRTGNVTILGPDGRAIERLCAHPHEMVPDCDTMLSQMFLLRDPEGEQHFLRIANRH